jgi:hypothetical protein
VGNLLRSIFFWNIKAAPNYTEKLILTGIDTITLLEKRRRILAEVYDYDLGHGT